MAESDMPPGSNMHFRILPLVLPNSEGIPVNISEVRRICAMGLSEAPPEDRCYAWLTLLGLYPLDASKWPYERDQIFAQYWSYVKDFELVDWTQKLVLNTVISENIPAPDQALMFQIHGDIIRTGRQILFLPPEEPQTGYDDPILAPFTGHMRRIERILYVFGKCNSTLSYLQGFNELIMPLYYVILSAGPFIGLSMDQIEALSFEALQSLIASTDLQSLYTTQDQSSIIMHKLKDFTNVLREQMPDTAALMESLEMHPLSYCYRWFNLLYAQEHDLPNLLILWDGLFAHIEEITDFSYYVGVAQLRTVKDKLDPQSFPDTIMVLQNLNVQNVFSVLKDANEMWKRRRTRSQSRILGWIKPNYDIIKKWVISKK